MASRAMAHGAQLFLPGKESINATNTNGFCLLHFAAMLGSTAGVEALCSAGADIEIRESSGFTPLGLAVVKDHGEAVKCLLARKADANAYLEGSSILLLALSGSPPDEDIVCALVKAGANVNHCGKDRRSPIHLAAGKGLLEAAKEMIAHGANTGALDDGGRTPLDVASNFCPPSKRTDMMRILQGHNEGNTIPRYTEEQHRSSAQVCSSCGKPDPQGMYQLANNGMRLCRSCSNRRGPLMDL